MLHIKENNSLERKHLVCLKYLLFGPEKGKSLLTIAPNSESVTQTCYVLTLNHVIAQQFTHHLL